MNKVVVASLGIYGYKYELCLEHYESDTGVEV